MRWRITFHQTLEFPIRCWTGPLRTSMCEKPQWFRAKQLGPSTLLSCARKMVEYEEKTHTTQNLHVLRQAMKKNCKEFLPIQNATLSKLDTSFWASLYHVPPAFLSYCKNDIDIKLFVPKSILFFPLSKHVIVTALWSASSNQFASTSVLNVMNRRILNTKKDTEFFKEKNKLGETRHTYQSRFVEGFQLSNWF